MGVNPKSFKSGGILNGKDVTWTGYQFQVKTFPARSADETPWSPVNCEIRFRIDGADEDIKQYLKMGNAEAWGGISADGLRLLTPEGQTLSSGNQLAILLASFEKAGFPADVFDADDTPEYISMEHLVARKPRFRIETPINEEKTAQWGKQKNKTTGKEYDRRDLVATKFYGYTVNAVPQKGAKTASGASGTTNAAPVDLRVVANTTVANLLRKSGGSLAKGKLPTKVTAELGSKHPQLDEARRFIYSDEYLNSGGDGTFGYDADTQTLTLV